MACVGKDKYVIMFDCGGNGWFRFLENCQYDVDDEKENNAVNTRNVLRPNFCISLQNRYLFLLIALFVASASRVAMASEWPITTAEASSASLPILNGYDNNPATYWSSDVHVSPTGSVEWYAYYFNAFYNVNFVRLTPRFSGANALGFPVTFDIYWSDGTNWNLVRSVSNMQRPYRNDDIILTFPTTISCNGIRIQATTLGDDMIGNYVFQMAEFRAGYDSSFDKFVWIGNNGSSSHIEIRSIGARKFNPNRMANWNPDERSPLIQANSGVKRNIYAPSLIKNGTSWNIYFGGWDGTTDGHDRISQTVTTDNFMTFGTHTVKINNGAFDHVNNECVVKIADNDWRMAYTTLNYVTPKRNKPGYATSSDGINWTPNTGSSSYLMTMSGYPNWANADINGSNVIYYENGTFHLYFDDFQNWGVHYATSTDNINYTYQSKTLTDNVICNDLKRLWYNGSNYYLWAYHHNTNQLWYSRGTNPSSPGTVTPLFTSTGSADYYITSAGWVVNGNRLLGVLYGAGPVISLDQNSIYARWLQQKVIFVISQSLALGTSGVQAYGPDILHIDMVSGQNVETGRFYIYDEDGTTHASTIPKATILTGDIWESRLNVVDMDDLRQFSGQWLKTGNSFDADFDRNNVVDIADFAAFCDSWLSVCPADWPL